LLHSQSRQASTQNIYQIRYGTFFLLLSFALVLFLLVSCKDGKINPNINLTLDKFSNWKEDSLVLNSHKIREYIYLICKTDKDSTEMDFRTRSYYLNGGKFLWIDRQGIDGRADSLLVVLNKVGEIGFTRKSFFTRQIKSDIDIVRTLDFRDNLNNINIVMARLEYYLTKAYFRYARGQNYGFVNPEYIFNRQDPLNFDTLGNPISYRRLFDVEMKHSSKKFYETAMRKIAHDSICEFLNEIKPRDSLYHKFASMLKNKNLSYQERLKILCNMERRRWRVKQHPEDKYVLVNIPSFKLRAVDHGQIIEMNIGCGKNDTKTPLLTSSITRMDLNPKWNVPMSIIKNEIARNHAGDVRYFEHNKMYIMYKKTGEKLNPAKVTPLMLMSGDLRVIQEGGEENSLGRIIFRFPNNFSVFLHDTSNRDFFENSNRGVSHGCVRVERPLDLAVFLLENKDSLLVDKLRLSMDIPPHTDEGLHLLNSGNKRPLGSLAVKPSVPVFITYYTMYPDQNGNILNYPDVYGYDKILVSYIKPFLK
jgi:L,D-transpeptidase YcbB